MNYWEAGGSWNVTWNSCASLNMGRNVSMTVLSACACTRAMRGRRAALRRRSYPLFYCHSCRRLTGDSQTREVNPPWSLYDASSGESIVMLCKYYLGKNIWDRSSLKDRSVIGLFLFEPDFISLLFLLWTWEREILCVFGETVSIDYAFWLSFCYILRNKCVAAGWELWFWALLQQ